MWRGRCEGGSAVSCWRTQARLRVRRLGAILATLLLLGFVPPPSTRADEAEVYRFGPGDRLRIAVLNDPAMSGEFTVQQSGGISLPSVGRIQVVGRGLDELQEEVVTRLRESGLIEPQISVEVAEYRPVYVVGDVKTPGSYPFRMGMTVLQALAVAGGFLTLDDETLSLRLQVLQAQDSIESIEIDHLAAIARRARLFAERDGAEEIQFPPEIVERQNEPQIAGMIDSESRLFQTGRGAVTGEIAILENQKNKLHDEIANLEAQLKAIERRDQLVETELRDVEYLFGKGLTAKTRLLELQRLLTDVQRDRLEVAAAVARAQQDISKVDLSIANLRNERLNRILGDLDAAQKDISQLEIRRRTGKEILALRQAMSKQPAVKLILSGESFVITRDKGEGPEDIAATDRSYVLPGDVVRVFKFELAPAARVDVPAAGVAAIKPTDPVVVGQ
jgi:polysaccharide export outer membrane protein